MQPNTQQNLSYPDPQLFLPKYHTFITLTHAYIFEVQRPAILPLQPALARVELTRRAASALWRIRTIEEGYMVVPYIPEPVDLAAIQEETQGDCVNRCISPSFVEETTCSVQVSEIILIGLRSPERHVCDFEIGPEVACRIAMSSHVDVRPSFIVGKPFHGVVLCEMLWMCGKELYSLWPE